MKKRPEADEIGRIMAKYVATWPEDIDRVMPVLGLLASLSHPTDRKNMAGHVTSSALVLDRTRSKILMIGHKALNEELPPGGHHDGGKNIHATAIRELEEETGLTGTKPHGGKPHAFDVDMHPIPARPEKEETEHVHHDVLWLETCDHEFEPVLQEEEVTSCRWVPLAEAQAMNERMARVVPRLIEAGYALA